MPGSIFQPLFMSGILVPAFTNIGIGNGSAVASYTITTPTISAGKLIVVCVEDFGSGGPNACGDTAGNTYTKLTLGATFAAIFYAWNSLALSTGNTITITKRDSSNGSVATAFYFTNVQTSSDPHDSAVDAVGTTTVTSGTPAASGELFIGIAGALSSPSTFSGDAGHGWSTSPPTISAAFGVGVCAGYQVNTGVSTKIWTPVFDQTANLAGVTGFKHA